MMTLMKIYVTFLYHISESTWDQYFSGVSTILISNEFCRPAIWKEELYVPTNTSRKGHGIKKKW